MLGRSASLLQARSCGVFIWDKDKNTLNAIRPFAGMEDGNLGTLEFPVGGSMMGTAVLHDKAVLIDDSANGQHDVQLLRELKIQNAVTVPLALERRDEANEVVERSIMGTFCAFDKYYGRPFDMEDARLLSMMARQVSAVLVTSQLFWKEVESRKRIKDTLESTSVGLLAVSPKGTVTQFNAAARQAMGVRDTTWFGHHYDELVQNHEVRSLIEDALSGSPSTKPIELTLRVRGQDGEDEERIYRVQIDEIRSEENVSTGWVSAFEDITDIRQAERMMAAFVDMISHELRTPLTSIRGFVATLLQAGEGIFDWDTQSEFLQIVDTEAERLGHMIDEQLNIARIQNGRGVQFQFHPSDVRQVAAQVVRLQSQSSAKKPNHELVIDIAEDFPMFQMDESKIVQVMHNLVGNALKYSPNGGEVRISARDYEGGLRIGISDQGLGIPKEQIGKMFGQFFRVEGQSHQGIKGTGLGLWLTKHLVEGHGGRIWVESDFGHGSTFFIWLPPDPTAHTKPASDH
jgi:two-component system phosphate regulon sensor histidine kinase PhoR